MIPILLTMSVFTAYFIESIFGFGGTILALAAISNFIDMKAAILIAAYAAIWASSFILISGFKHFSLSHFIKIYTYALPGVLIGTVIFLWASPVFLLKFFAAFLIVYSLYALWNPNIKMPKILSRIILFISGIIHGIFGTGGPFMLMAYGHEFGHKSELRTMVAAYLLFGNIIRFVQMALMGKLEAEAFIGYWWIVAPIALAIGLGFVLHLKLNDTLFKRGVLCMMLLSGLAFLVK